nr:hypothetical protein [uncultured archaeon]
MISVDKTKRTAYVGPFMIAVHPTPAEQYYPHIYSVMALAVLFLRLLVYIRLLKKATEQKS